jgi:hypothetical protein
MVHMYICVAKRTSSLFSYLATGFKFPISHTSLLAIHLHLMPTTNNQTAPSSATGSNNQPAPSTPNSARTYDHSQVFLRGTEHGFGLRTGTCCSALDPTHAALHARHFGKIAESLNGEHNITNDEDFTNRVETICKTHHVKYPNISINPTVFGTGKESEFSVRLDACDSKNDFLLEIEMRIKNPEGLSAAKLMAKDD